MEPIKPVSGAVARPEFSSLVELVRYHATHRPKRSALIFLPGSLYAVAIPVSIFEEIL